MSRGEEKREGLVLDGRYRVRERLGEGGMGSVHVVEHLGLGQLRAVKFLHHELLRKPDAIKRFLREARVLASLRHPHIIEVLDVGEHDGAAYYVMELLSGEDLRSVLRREGRLSWTRVRGLVLQIGAALVEAHERGVVHRDMKPENCLCIRRPDFVGEFVKVIDFGVAKVMGEAAGTRLTVTGETLGTIAYMPPEQIESRGDHRVDVYAVGVMLYEMLSGRLPHVGPAMEVIVRLARGVAPARLRDVAPEVPRALDDAVMCAMEHDPSKRFADMRTLLGVLEALPPDGPPYAPPPGRAAPNAATLAELGQLATEGAGPAYSHEMGMWPTELATPIASVEPVPPDASPSALSTLAGEWPVAPGSTAVVASPGPAPRSPTVVEAPGPPAPRSTPPLGSPLVPVAAAPPMSRAGRAWLGRGLAAAALGAAALGAAALWDDERAPTEAQTDAMAQTLAPPPVEPSPAPAPSVGPLVARAAATTGADDSERPSMAEVDAPAPPVAPQPPATATATVEVPPATRLSERMLKQRFKKQLVDQGCGLVHAASSVELRVKVSPPGVIRQVELSSTTITAPVARQCIEKEIGRLQESYRGKATTQTSTFVVTIALEKKR